MRAVDRKNTTALASQSCLQNFVKAFGDDGIFTGLQHPDTDDDGVGTAGQTGAGRAAAGAGIQFNTGSSLAQFLSDFRGGDSDVVLIVADQEMRDVIGNGRNESLGVYRGKSFDTGGDKVSTFLELRLEGGIFLAEEPVNGGEETHDFFLGNFQAAADGVGVGGIVELGSFDEILAAEEQAGALRTAKALAARKGDEIKTHLGVVPEI